MAQIFKYIFSLAFLLLVNHKIYADNYTVLVIETANGEELIRLDEKPVINFQGTHIEIEATGFSCERSAVNNMYFKDVEDTTSEIVQLNEERSIFYYSNNKVFISANKITDDDVKIYNINGMKMNIPVQKGDKEMIIDFSGTGKGIFIIKAKDKTYKINRI